MGADGRSANVLVVSVVQTVLVYVLIPAGIYGLIAVLTLVPKTVKAPRYRSGQPWTYEPVWWRAADGAIDHDLAPTENVAEPSVRTARGGARGNW